MPSLHVIQRLARLLGTVMAELVGALEQ